MVDLVRTTVFAHEDIDHPADVTSMTDRAAKSGSTATTRMGTRDSVTDPLTNETTWVFNDRGLPESMTSPRGNPVCQGDVRHLR